MAGQQTAGTQPRHRAWSRARLDDALRAATRQCAQNGARLTPRRREVLALLLERSDMITAYDLLDALAARLKRRISPPTIYRALDFLVTQGLVAKVESRNAYVACRHIETPHDHLLLLCKCCGQSEEIHEPRIERALADAAARAGFASESRVIEVTGLCNRCGGGRAREKAGERDRA